MAPTGTLPRPVVLLLALAACGLPDPAPVPDSAIAFAVFGDGPYYSWENGRFARLVEDVNRHELAFLLHVGDVLDAPCSDAMYEARAALLNTIAHPVIYVPGDNEWTDCHTMARGRRDPLERLAALRRVFFAAPHRSLGASTIPLETQADDSAFAGFPEHRRWRRGRVLFVTLHLVGSDNGAAGHDGRRPEQDAEVVARTAAALAWVDAAFALARADTLRGVILAFHGEPGFAEPAAPASGFDAFRAAIAGHARTYDGQVLLVHGDWHELHVDHPLRDPGTGEPLANVTRLETFGSPDIGWVRVVVDTATGRFVDFEPRLMPRRWVLF